MTSGRKVEFMKFDHKDIEGSRREFAFEIPAEEVKKILDKAYKEINGQISIPGFRKGKAPREMIEKYHGDEARERAARDMVGDLYSQALRESETIPVGLPHISDLEFTDGKSANFKAIVDIRPKVDLLSYDKIKVEKRKIEVKQEEVDKHVSMIQESYAEFKPADDRQAGPGDYLVCDVSCASDGKPLYEQKKNIWLHMDKEQSLPELVDGLTGSGRDETKEIPATLPQDKKKVVFTIKVNSIKVKELPEINDDFIKKLGHYKDLTDLKEAAKRDLLRKKENEAMVDLKNQIYDQLLKGSRFVAPQGLVDEEIERIEEEAREGLRKNNVDKDDIEKRIGEFREKFKAEAVKRVKLYFILEEIAALEGINVADGEVEEALNMIAQQSNTTLENVKKHYTENKMLGYLKSQIKENKITGILLSKIDIK
ncbi:MAG: trigger factor [Candidatus Omnitrophota bacterium]